jgi:cell division protein FtsZ
MPQIVKPDLETIAKIKVVGVGGSGGSSITRMIEGKVRGVDFIAMNTDIQALHHNPAPSKLHIGKGITRGPGAGMDPEVGQKAATESQNEIRDMLKDSDMVFITCGMGGGTGTGASPVVAEIAREMGALTVAVVTKPFAFEGHQRSGIADRGWEELAKNVDTIITIPNDRILQIIDKKTPLLEAFKMVDEVMRQGVQGISEIITTPGLINVDFADVKAIMKGTGSALMGIGTGSGENKAVEAAKMAISSPLLELSIDGARGILFTITGGSDLTMNEVNEAAKIITNSASEDAKIIFGANIDETMNNSMRVTVIATGFEDQSTQPSSLHMSSRKEEEPTQNFFGGGKFVPHFLKKPTLKNEQEEVEEKPMKSFAPPKVTSSPLITRDQKAKASDDEDKKLEIPAFIRKKMEL